jgi:hypothetical protein
MGNRFALGKHAISQCDRCDFRYPLKVLRRLVIKTKNINLLVCPTCWDPDHPQLQLGMYPVDDPQGLRDPRPDRSYIQSGPSGLQIDVINPPNPNDTDAFGYPEGGSRIIQWGWAPVGFNNVLDLPIRNNLEAQSGVGSVTVVTS